MKQQALFKLLGEDYVRIHFPHHKYNPKLLDKSAPGKINFFQKFLALSFLGQGPMLCNFFRCNYVAIGVTSVKINGKYAASDVNYAQTSFIILATGSKPVDCDIKIF